jgi:hypothetical protein
MIPTAFATYRARHEGASLYGDKLFRLGKGDDPCGRATAPALQDLVLVGDGPPRLIFDKFSTDQPFVIQV